MPIEITNMATEILVNVILGILTLFGALATLYIQKGIRKLQVETEKIKDEATRDLLNSALGSLDDVALKTVNKIEQTTKKQLLEGVANGTVSPDKIKELANQAYNEITQTLKPEYLQVIQKTMGDSQTYILNLIEQKLQEIKINKPHFVFSDLSKSEYNAPVADEAVPALPGMSS